MKILTTILIIGGLFLFGTTLAACGEGEDGAAPTFGIVGTGESLSTTTSTTFVEDVGTPECNEDRTGSGVVDMKAGGNIIQDGEVVNENSDLEALYCRSDCTFSRPASGGVRVYCGSDEGGNPSQSEIPTIYTNSRIREVCEVGSLSFCSINYIFVEEAAYGEENKEAVEESVRGIDLVEGEDKALYCINYLISTSSIFDTEPTLPGFLISTIPSFSSGTSTSFFLRARDTVVRAIKEHGLEEGFEVAARDQEFASTRSDLVRSLSSADISNLCEA